MTFTLYELHFTQPYKHARHYIGVTSLSVADRLERHRGVNGAKLLQALFRSGGDVVVWRTQTFTGRGAREKAYAEERRLKRRGGVTRRCIICRDASNLIDLGEPPLTGYNRPMHGGPDDINC
jgi:predicted GIY-YIG superfamily endonuclease